MASQANVNQQVQRATQVQAKYADMLMGKPHVVGVAVGYVTEGGQRTTVIGLIVMVDHKLPASEIAAADMIPRELDGVRVDVQETGVFSAN